MNIGREIGGISIRSDNSPLPLANVSSAKAAALIVEAWGNAPGIVLRRRRCLIISPPRDGFAVANLGQRPKLREIKTASAESAIHFPGPLRRAFSACLRNDLNPGGCPRLTLDSAFGAQPWLPDS